jgi:hypothetical protein
MHLVVELSGGRHFPRSQSVGFAVQCQLIGQQRISCVSRGTDAPFWGDLFSWELSGALLRQLQASTPSLKLQVVMIKGEGVGRIEQPLGHVVVSLKGVRCCQPTETRHPMLTLTRGPPLAGAACSSCPGMARAQAERRRARPLWLSPPHPSSGDQHPHPPPHRRTAAGAQPRCPARRQRGGGSSRSGCRTRVRGVGGGGWDAQRGCAGAGGGGRCERITATRHGTDRSFCAEVCSSLRRY